MNWSESCHDRLRVRVFSFSCVGVLGEWRVTLSSRFRVLRRMEAVLRVDRLGMSPLSLHVDCFGRTKPSRVRVRLFVTAFVRV